MRWIRIISVIVWSLAIIILIASWLHSIHQIKHQIETKKEKIQPESVEVVLIKHEVWNGEDNDNRSDQLNQEINQTDSSKYNNNYYSNQTSDIIAKTSQIRRQKAEDLINKAQTPLTFGYDNYHPKLFHLNLNSDDDIELAREICSIYDKISLFRTQMNADRVKQMVWDIHDHPTLMDVKKLKKFRHCAHLIHVVKQHHKQRLQLMNVTDLPKMTVLINTWKREDCLLEMLDWWTKMDQRIVNRVVVISTDPDTLIRWKKHSSSSILYQLLNKNMIRMNNMNVYLHTLVLGSNKLTDRFKYDSSIMTDVVFPVDDDLKYHPMVVANMLNLYAIINENRHHHRIAISVSPSMRQFFFTHVTNDQMKLGDFGYRCNLAQWRNDCQYNAAFFTLGGVIHSEYLIQYHNDIRLKHIRKMVDEYVNGEDISMSLMYSSIHGGMPPLIVLRKETYFLQSCSLKLSDKMHDSNANTNRLEIAKQSAIELGFTTEDDDNAETQGLILRNSNMYFTL